MSTASDGTVQWCCSSGESHGFGSGGTGVFLRACCLAHVTQDAIQRFTEVNMKDIKDEDLEICPYLRSRTGVTIAHAAGRRPWPGNGSNIQHTTEPMFFSSARSLSACSWRLKVLINVELAHTKQFTNNLWEEVSKFLSSQARLRAQYMTPQTTAPTTNELVRASHDTRRLGVGLLPSERGLVASRT